MSAKVYRDDTIWTPRRADLSEPPACLPWSAEPEETLGDTDPMPLDEAPEPAHDIDRGLAIVGWTSLAGVVGFFAAWRMGWLA